MINGNNIMKAYLYLCALERGGEILDRVDIHAAWVMYCRGDLNAGHTLYYCAADGVWRLYE